MFSIKIDRFDRNKELFYEFYNDWHKIDQMRSFIYKINLALFEHLEIIRKTLNEMYRMFVCFVIVPTNARK